MKTEALATSAAEKKMIAAEKKALKEQGLREEMEYEAEVDAARGRSMIMTGANDAIETLGAYGIAKVALAIPGAEKVALAAGGLVQCIRPFTEHDGWGRLATALPNGAFQGAVALTTYKSGLESQETSG